MGVLETVMQLKQQGQTEPQIINYLKQEGVSPNEINEALSQSKIKSALTENPPTASTYPNQPTSEIQQPQRQMQPSMMQTQGMQQSPQDIEQQFQSMQEYPQEMQNTYSSIQPSTMSMTEMQAPEPMQFAPQEQYSQDYYPEYAPAETSIETINEVANQIVDERTAQLKKQISSFNSFKENALLELGKLNERLSQVEDTLNELQMAIIGKIGEYGKNIQNISNEMHATQDSFSKILNPLTDNIKELQKLTGKETPNRPKPKTKSKSKQSKSNFEDYLR